MHNNNEQSFGNIMGIIIRIISQWSFKMQTKKIVFIIHLPFYWLIFLPFFYLVLIYFSTVCHSLPLTLAVLPQRHGRPLPVSALSDVVIPGSCRPSCLPSAMLWTCSVSEPCVQMESFYPLTLLAVDETRDARAAY